MNDLLTDLISIYLLVFSPLLFPLLGWFFGKVGDFIRQRDSGR